MQARRLIEVLAGGVATGLCSMALVATGQAPAHADASKPVVAGTYTVQVKVQKNTDPQIIDLKAGSRTYTFGAGCRVGSACTFQRGQADGSSSPQKAAAGG